MKHDRNRESKAFFDFSSREFGQRLPKRRMETSVNRAKKLSTSSERTSSGSPKSSEVSAPAAAPACRRTGRK